MKVGLTDTEANRYDKKEALKQAINGAEVRSTAWPSNRYITYNDDHGFVDQYNEPWNNGGCQSTVWEYYHPSTYDKAEAINMMVNDSKVMRAGFLLVKFSEVDFTFKDPRSLSQIDINKAPIRGWYEDKSGDNA